MSYMPVGKASHIINQLRTNYQDASRLERDVNSLLQMHNSLLAQLSNEISSNNRPMNLLKLQGTIPVSINNNMYNIPVAFVFQPHYPRLGPDVYVTPTAQMDLAPNHPHVQAGTGKVFMPYLSEWTPATSNLVMLAAAMIRLFASNPPVFARQRKPATVPAPKPQAIMNDKLPANPTEQLRMQLQQSLKSRFYPVLDPIMVSIDRQLAMQDLLKDRKEAVENDAKALEDASTIANTRLEDLTVAAQNISSAIDMISSAQFQADKIVTAQDSINSQLLDLIAEECACEDLLSFLEESLRQKKLPLSTYLETVREECRGLFVTRQLKNKLTRKLHVQQSKLNPATLL